MSKQFITLDNLNKISYQVYGTGSHTLILFHGLAGGSWLNPEILPTIDDADIRLIALERAGYGHSSPLKFESLQDWGPILQIIVKELHINTADVAGISAGAPYAYAAAHFLPKIIKKIWILAGVPAVYENDILKHYTESDQELYKSFIKTATSELQERYLKDMKAALERLQGHGESYITQTFEEIIDQDCYGMALESKLQILPWKIDLSSIEQPVTMYHAKADEMIPFEAAKEMSRYLKNLTFYELAITGDNVHMKTSADAFSKVLQQYSSP